MNSVVGYFSSQINPLQIIYKYLYRLILGKVMMTEDVDVKNFAEKGMEKMRLDPKKVNLILATLPLKLIHGVVQNLKITADVKNLKLSVSIDLINLTMYLDDHSQYQRRILTLKDANNLDFGSGGDENGDQTNENGFIQKMISSFELSFSLKKFVLNLRTEKPDFPSSLLNIQFEELKVQKPKQKSASISQSFTITLKSLTVQTQEVNQKEPVKFCSLCRLERKGEAMKTKEALQINIDIIQKNSTVNSKGKLVVRGDIGSLQAILTFGNIFTILKLVEKLGDFSLRQAYMNRDLFSVMKSVVGKGKNKMMTEAVTNDNGNNIPDDDDEIFHSFKQIYNSNLFASLTHSLVHNNLQNPPQEAENEKSDVSTPIIEDLKSSLMDIDIEWQGAYIGVLKESSFETSDMFTWITSLGYQEIFGFHEVVCSYFLFCVEKVRLIHDDAAKIYNAIIQKIWVNDFIYKGNNPIKETSFSKRVDIGGMENTEFLLISINDDDAFKSVCEPSNIFRNKYDVMTVLRIDKQQEKGCVSIKYETTQPLSLTVDICCVFIDIDIIKFTFVKKRNSIYDDLVNIGEVLQSIQKQFESNSIEYCHKYYGGMTRGEFQNIIDEVRRVLDSLGNISERERLLRLLDMKDMRKITQAETPKIVLQIKGLNFKVGGVLDAMTNQVSHLTMRCGNLTVLVNKQIVVSWKNNIDFELDSLGEKHLLASIIGDKENVIGIDESKMVVKITGIDISFSPQIFHGLLIIAELADQRLKKVEMGQKKFNIQSLMDSISKIRSRSYVLFEEELKINEIVNKIHLNLTSGNPLIEKVHFYLGRISLRVYDDDLTKEIIESSIDQKKKEQAAADDWIILEDDEDNNNKAIDLKDKIEKDIQKRESYLRNIKSILHLELKTVMGILGLNHNNDFNLMIHTILLRDGLTDHAYRQNSYNYQTMFCEVYSINYNQPSYDAKLKGNFDMKQSLQVFTKIMEEFKSKGAFLEVKKRSKLDFGMTKPSSETTVNMSSFVARFAMHTTAETFLCLIKLIDSTVVRLESLSELIKQLQEKEENQDLKNFRKKSHIEKQKSPVKQSTEKSSLIVNLSSIYLDVFEQETYRVLLEVKNTKISIENDESSNKVTQASLHDIRLSFTKDKICSMDKNVSTADKKNTHYFSLFKLKRFDLGMRSSVVQDGMSSIMRNQIHINLPEVGYKNLIIRLDIESLSVLLSISNKIDHLLNLSKKKTMILFLELNEYRNRRAKLVSNIAQENDEWERIGLKVEESRSIRKQFNELKMMPPSIYNHHYEESSKESEERIQKESIEYFEEKFKVANQILSDIYIEQLSNDKSENIIELRIDRITVNLFQIFEVEGPSFISLRLKETLVAIKTNESKEEIKDGERISTTTALVASVRSLKVVDRTRSTMFKYLINLPKHSLCLYARTRVTVDKTLKVKQLSADLKKSYLIENKIAIILDIAPIQVYLGNHSVTSLRTFAMELLETMKAKKPSSSEVIEEDSHEEESAEMEIDYIDLCSMKLSVYSRSDTNLSFVNYVPDINLEFSVYDIVKQEKYIEYDTPLSGGKLGEILQKRFMQDLKPWDILKGNVKNLPVLASLASLFDGLNTVYCAVTNNDGLGVLVGFGNIIMTCFNMIVKTGQFGMKTISDVSKLLGNRLFTSVIDFEEMYVRMEKLSNRIIGKRAAGLKSKRVQNQTH